MFLLNYKEIYFRHCLWLGQLRDIFQYSMAVDVINVGRNELNSIKCR